MAGFCDECDRFVNKLYKAGERTLCRLCTIEEYGFADEEIYDLDDYDNEEEESDD